MTMDFYFEKRIKKLRELSKEMKRGDKDKYEDFINEYNDFKDFIEKYNEVVLFGIGVIFLSGILINQFSTLNLSFEIGKFTANIIFILNFAFLIYSVNDLLKVIYCIEFRFKRIIFYVFMIPFLFMIGKLCNNNENVISLIIFVYLIVSSAIVVLFGNGFYINKTLCELSGNVTPKRYAKGSNFEEL